MAVGMAVGMAVDIFSVAKSISPTAYRQLWRLRGQALARHWAGAARGWAVRWRRCAAGGSGS